METYCWIHSTFTIADNVDGIIGKNVISPGVSTVVNSKVKYHKYYQWTCFVVFFQAMFFYAPRFLWKTWEGRRLSMLVQDLDEFVSDKCKADQKKLLVKYICGNIQTLNTYAYRFFICELLNFANVIAQIILMDYFLGGEFSTYGYKVFMFNNIYPENRTDPMSWVFPKITKCTFHKYGPSGSIQNIDSLCVLPLNNVNEKFFLFLWIWFCIVAILSGLSIVYRLIVLVSPKFRCLLLRSRSHMTSKQDIQQIIELSQIGCWFTLYQLSKSINPLIFKEILCDLIEYINSNDVMKIKMI